MIFLLDKTRAFKAFCLHMQYWQIDDTQMEQAFQFALRNSQIHYEKLAQYLNAPSTFLLTYLQSVYVFQVGERYFLHAVYSDSVEECELTFLLQSEQIFSQQRVAQIPDMHAWLIYYLKIANKHYHHTKISNRLHIIMQQLTRKNPKSMQLKTALLVEVLYRFTKGEMHYPYVLRQMARMKLDWKRGKWALTLKERALFAYLAMQIAHTKKQWKKVSDEANFLLKQDRFMDVAVELMIAYGDLLQTVQPQPGALIKNYRTNVFENFFYMYIEALAKQQKYKLAWSVLESYEIATTTTIYRYIHMPTPEHLVAVEAAVQQNIALLMDSSISYVKQSLQKWYESYEQLEEAKMSSQYICYMLETLFIGEQYELFERLMAIYVKYLKIEADYARLKERIAEHMERRELHEKTLL